MQVLFERRRWSESEGCLQRTCKQTWLSTGFSSHIFSKYWKLNLLFVACDMFWWGLWGSFIKRPTTVPLRKRRRAYFSRHKIAFENFCQIFLSTCPGTCRCAVKFFSGVLSVWQVSLFLHIVYANSLLFITCIFNTAMLWTSCILAAIKKVSFTNYIFCEKNKHLFSRAICISLINDIPSANVIVHLYTLYLQSQKEAEDWEYDDDSFSSLNPTNKWMTLWFRGKCIEDQRWCI